MAVTAAKSARNEAMAAARAIFVMGETKGDMLWSRLATMRSYAPVFFFEEIGQWIVTGFEEVKILKSSSAVSVGFEARNDTIRPGWREHPGRANMADWFGFQDGERHHRTRMALSKYFLPKGVQHVVAPLEVAVTELLSALKARGSGNFLEEVSFPLTEAVSNFFLGLDASTRPPFRKQIQQMMKTLEFQLTPEAWCDADAAADEIRAFWIEEVERRADNPIGDDMITQLVREGEFSTRQIAIIAENVIAAATDTTAQTSANGLLLLLKNPEECARARLDPALRKNLSSEILRLSTAAVFNGCLMIDDLEVGGETIPKGAVVMIGLGAANRDPSVFPDPDSFDLSRSFTRHIALGHGIHSCLGSVLANMVLTRLFEQLLTDYHVELDGPAPEISGVMLRQLPELQVRLH